VLNILALFRHGRPPQRKRKAAPGGWQEMDLDAMEGGSMPSGRTQTRRAAAPAAKSPAKPAAGKSSSSWSPKSFLSKLLGGKLLGGKLFGGPSGSGAPRPRRQQPIVRRDAADGYLAAHGLEKSYGARRVVNGVSIYVRRGEAVGLLGPNGAGKTTAFYTITGLIKPERGQIELDGYDVTHLPMYQRARLGIGYLPQEASIFRGLNVEDNIRAVLEVVEPDRRRRDADLEALLAEFEITARRKTPSIALSGGERRRVEIARALATRPNYMLLDEPFAGIDPKAVVEIQRLVRRLTNRGIGVLITDHNVRETLDLTDRSYIIYSGEVLMEGRKDDIVNDPQVRQLYLGEDFRI